MLHFLQLGASLYIPATRSDLLPIANGDKYPSLRSMVFCTEDSIHQDELPSALTQLERLLPRLEPTAALRFVRVRTPAVLHQVLAMPGAAGLTGFVLPKITQQNVHHYFSAFRPEDTFLVMPTLETAEAFELSEMIALRQTLLQPQYRKRILSLRIGGNDLFQILGMRRPRGRSIYHTALRAILDQLVAIFRPHGINLTGAVFEYLDTPEILGEEVQSDLAHGLFGKTAIHPTQVSLIESHYRVHPSDIEMATRILSTDAPAVFRLYDSMCEVATHRVWAQLIHKRATLYGIEGQPSAPEQSIQLRPDVAGTHQAFTHENGTHAGTL